MPRALVLVLLLALGVRLAAIDHGLPHRYVPDTHMIRGALGMASSKDLAPPAGKYTSYPYLMPYLLLPEFAALYLGGRALGVYADAADFGARIVDDPTPVYRIARVVVLLFGLLGVGLAWRIGRRVGGRRVALIAAYLVATSFLWVHLGKSARTWVPLGALVLLCGERSIAYVRRPTAGRALWMGVSAGLAMACHQAGGLAVLLPASAVVARVRLGVGRAAIAGLLAAVCFGATALLVGFPYLLRGGTAAVGVNDRMTEQDAVNLGGQSLAFQAFGTERFAEIAIGFVTAEPALLALLLLGLFCGRPRPRRLAYLPVLLVYPMAVLLLFLFYNGTHVRYLSPAVPFLAVAAALGAVGLRRTKAGALAVPVLLAAPLLLVLRLDWLLTRQDTRTEFLATIAREVPTGATVAVEAYGPPLRFTAAAVERLLADGRWASRAEGREATGEAPADPQRPGYDVVPIERYYEFASAWPQQFGQPGDPQRVAKPIETFLDERGVAYLVQVDRTPGGPRNSALDEVLARRGTRLAELAPYHGEPPCEAMLPMDPQRPWFGLWRVHRPGPSLVLWRIDAVQAERRDR